MKEQLGKLETSQNGDVGTVAVVQGPAVQPQGLEDAFMLLRPLRCSLHLKFFLVFIYILLLPSFASLLPLPSPECCLLSHNNCTFLPLPVASIEHLLIEIVYTHARHSGTRLQPQHGRQKQVDLCDEVIPSTPPLTTPNYRPGANPALLLSSRGNSLQTVLEDSLRAKAKDCLEDSRSDKKPWVSVTSPKTNERLYFSGFLMRRMQTNPRAEEPAGRDG